MKQSIFYSWQADTAPNLNRSFIERALERAVSELASDTSIEEAVRSGKWEIDKDTKNVPGMPPIVETILKKIDAASAFVADFTFSGKRDDGRPTPNPNVLVEYGYALRSLGHGALIAVMNSHFGAPSEATLPFNIRHLRHPITYSLAPDASIESKADTFAGLVKQLKAALRISLAESSSSEVANVKFPAARATSRPSRFRELGQPVGQWTGLRGDSVPVHIADGPTRWLRLMPTSETGKRWLKTELEELMWRQGRIFPPLDSRPSSWGKFLAKDGFGTYETYGEGPHLQATIVFETGEIWALQVFEDSERHSISIGEIELERAIKHYAKFMVDQLGLNGPFDWIAGIDGIEGWKCWLPTRPGYTRREYLTQPAQANEVIEAGRFDLSDDPLKVLKPFYRKAYDQFGFARPDEFDELQQYR